MRKLFKKALACCLVAALALTCFVGALSVNAETAAALTGKIEVGTVEVADDATTATVPVVITSDNALNAAKITVAASEGWEVSAIAIDAASTAAKIEPENINGDTFIVEAFDNIAGFTTATVNVTFTSKAAVAATITATLDPVHAATWNEDVVNLAVTDGAITVAAGCDHADAELVYSIVDGNCITTKVCACGNEEQIAAYDKLAITPALVLASGLAVRFRLAKAVAPAGLTDYYAIINYDLFEQDDNVVSGTSEDMNVVAEVSSTRYQFEYTGLSAKTMTAPIHVKVFATNADGNVVLVAATDFLISKYLKETYIDTDSTYKTLAADILRYGAETQKAFAYRPTVLPTAGVDESAFSALPTTFNNVVSNPSGNITMEPATVLGNTVTLRFRFNVISGVDASALSYTVSYKYKGEDVIETIPAGSVGYNGNKSKYQIDYSALPVAVIGNTYKITVFNGATELGSLDYSFQYDAQSKYASNHAYKTLAQAICAYSASAKAAFDVVA